MKMIDLHCHILPGLDDGAQSLEDALEIARFAEKDGVEKIVGTPHLYRGGFTPEDLGIIEEKRQELAQALRSNNINVELYAGAEVHIAHNLIEEIKKNREALVINQSSYMFVEFPSGHVFSGVKNLFFELMSLGINPVIAHPERNSVFVRNPSLLYELTQMGAYSQANSGSFTGVYGMMSQEAVFKFLELGFIHFIASDSHDTKSIPPKLSEAVRKAGEIIGDQDAASLVRDNPQAVLDDGELTYYPHAVDPREKEKSFHIRIPSIFRRKS
jgi:protein-tyrosine phosphatase